MVTSPKVHRVFYETAVTHFCGKCRQITGAISIKILNQAVLTMHLDVNYKTPHEKIWYVKLFWRITYTLCWYQHSRRIIGLLMINIFILCTEAIIIKHILIGFIQTMAAHLSKIQIRYWFSPPRDNWTFRHVPCRWDSRASSKVTSNPKEKRVYDVIVLALLSHRHIRHVARCLIIARWGKSIIIWFFDKYNHLTMLCIKNNWLVFNKCVCIV